MKVLFRDVLELKRWFFLGALQVSFIQVHSYMFQQLAVFVFSRCPWDGELISQENGTD